MIVTNVPAAGGASGQTSAADERENTIKITVERAKRAKILRVRTSILLRNKKLQAKIIPGLKKQKKNTPKNTLFAVCLYGDSGGGRGGGASAPDPAIPGRTGVAAAVVDP